MKLSANKNIENVCVVGDGLPQPIALVLSEYGKGRSKENVTASLAKTLIIVNTKLDHHEKVKRLVVLQEEWTIENKLLTLP